MLIKLTEIVDLSKAEVLYIEHLWFKTNQTYNENSLKNVRKTKTHQLARTKTICRNICF